MTGLRAPWTSRTQKHAAFPGVIHWYLSTAVNRCVNLGSKFEKKLNRKPYALVKVLKCNSASFFKITMELAAEPKLNLF